MNALQRLEQGGFTFDLTPNGEIAYRCPDDAPAQWVNTRAAHLLAEVAAHQEEVMTVLRARQEWNAVWDEWAACSAGWHPTSSAGAERDIVPRYKAHLRESAS